MMMSLLKSTAPVTIPVAIFLSLLILVSSCAYYEQATGTASAYYDAKITAWFKGACALNQGALGRIDEHRRSIVNAACPPRTEPIVEAAILLSDVDALAQKLAEEAAAAAKAQGWEVSPEKIEQAKQRIMRNLRMSFKRQKIEILKDGERQWLLKYEELIPEPK